MEIQRAHDTLRAVVTGEIRSDIDPATRTALRIALDTLCWALKHDHNDNFAKNLAALEADLAEAGLVCFAVTPTPN